MMRKFVWVETIAYNDVFHTNPMPKTQFDYKVKLLGGVLS